MYLKEYKDLFKIKRINEFAVSKIDTGNGCWYVTLQQKYNGLSVEKGEIGFTIEADGKVLLFGINYYPDINVELSGFKGMRYDKSVSVCKEKCYRSYNIIADSICCDQVILPMGEGNKEYLAVNKVTLRNIGKGFKVIYYVNSLDNQIIKIVDNMKSFVLRLTGTIGRCYRDQYYSDEPILYDVFPNCYFDIEDVLQNDTLFNSSHVSSSTGEIDIQFNSNYIGKKLLLADSYYNESVRDMFIKDYVYISSLDYAIVDTFSIYDSCEIKGFSGPESNIFYHISRIHDFWIEPPFEFTEMNYPIVVYPYGPFVNNSGATGGTIEFNQDGHWGYFCDVIYHEYNHCVVYKIYNNSMIGNTNSPDELNAMDEAFADYFTAVMTNSALIGENILTNPRNLNNQLKYNEFIADTANHGKYHLMSTILSGSCWDLRNLQGSYSPEDIDYFIFQALKRSPQPYSFADFTENLHYTCPFCDFTDLMNIAFRDNHEIPVPDICISNGPRKYAIDIEKDISKITVYPNPCRKELQIDFANTDFSGQVVIYNILGESVCKFNLRSYKNAGRIIWNCENQNGKRVKSGIYFVVYKGNYDEIVKKITVL